MKTFRWISVLLVLSALAPRAESASYKPADGPLKTKWAKDVSAENVWSQYPRPQLVRKEWLNLNGLWQYAIIATNDPLPSFYEGQILVPFPVESSLSGVMRRLDEKSRLIYRRTFQLPKKWSGQRVLLHFGAVDWAARVIVNDVELPMHRGGYDPFTFDITSAVKPGQEQEIIVDVFDPTEAGQPRGKQVRKPQGICYTPTSGIWQTVWIEPVPAASIQDLKIVPDVDGKMLRLTAAIRGPLGDEMVDAVAFADGREVGRKSGPGEMELQIPLSKVKLWSPEHPFLYDLKVTLRRGDVCLDSVTSYFAMRKIALGKDAGGLTRIFLNNQPIFQVGPLDQGFWPDGIYTPPTDAAMRYDLEMTKKLGFNMTRKHVKVEPDRWYYYCDKLGLLVWQDMPSGNNSSAGDKKEFEHELRRMIATHRNHPCIVMWVVFNEGWGQFDTERLTALVKELDPTRLVDNATGWTDKNVGDVIDMHKYPGPASPPAEENRAAVLGEFGGLKLTVPGHTWAKKSWGYKETGTAKALTSAYVDLLTKALELKKTGLSAVVYTQITDVETECNGLMTYDRAIVKPDSKAVAAANRKLEESEKLK
jgi:beta-galactosidase/beta-glucuronidase